MKLVTIADEQGGRPGLIHQASIFDLRVGHPSLSLSGWRPDSVVAVMDAGQAGRDHLQSLLNALDQADDAERQELKAAGALLPLRATRLAAPIRRSGLIISLEDSTEGLPRPFIKSAHTLVGPNERVSLGEHLGGETSAVAQIAAVLSRPGHRLSVGQVHGAVGGYLLAMDFTHQTEPERDGTDAQALMARSLGKQLPGSYPMGPFLATADEVENETVTVEMTVNGVRAGSWAAVDLVPRVHEALVWLSRYFSFKAGDVVAIGPSDVTGVMVGPDDDIRVQSTGLGELEIRVSA